MPGPLTNWPTETAARFPAASVWVPPLTMEAVSPFTTAAGRISKLPRISTSAKELPELSEKVAPFKKLALPSAFPQISPWPVQSTMSLVRSAAKPAKPVLGPACH